MNIGDNDSVYGGLRVLMLDMVLERKRVGEMVDFFGFDGGGRYACQSGQPEISFG